MPGVQHGQAGRVTPIHRRSSDAAPHVLVLLCMYSHAAPCSYPPLRSAGFSLAFLSPCPTSPIAPPSLCSTRTFKRVDQRPESLFVLLWEPPNSHFVGASSSHLPSSSPPPVTHQALWLRRARAICIRAALQSERECQSHPPPAKPRHLPAAFCQQAMVIILMF